MTSESIYERLPVTVRDR